jgi:hypothetical protein
MIGGGEKGIIWVFLSKQQPDMQKHPRSTAELAEIFRNFQFYLHTIFILEPFI